MQFFIINEPQHTVQNDALDNRGSDIFFLNLEMNVGCDLSTSIKLFLFYRTSYGDRDNYSIALK